VYVTIEAVVDEQPTSDRLSREHVIFQEEDGAPVGGIAWDNLHDPNGSFSTLGHASLLWR